MKLRPAFSITELLVVMGIISVLLTFASVSLLSVQNNASVNSAVALFMTDVRQQQLKAMNGDTMGTETAGAYGIYFSTNTYTLFHGPVYTPSDSSNYTIVLDPNLVFSHSTIPRSTVIFTPISGEVAGFTLGNNQISLLDTRTNESVLINFNRYGTAIID